MKYLILSSLIIAIAPALFATADDSTSPAQDESAQSQPSLDDLLLDDLDNQLLDGLVPPTEDGEAKASDGDPGMSDLDRQLLEQLGHGEDVGSESDNPFISIGQRMKAVEQRIGRRDTSEATQQIQRQIVADIEQLIEEMNKQCSGGQCNSSSKCDKPGSPKPGEQASKAGSGENSGTSKPARDSEDRLGSSDGTEAEMARMREMLKRVWGHLPERVRLQMQSGMAEEFLPEYERLIEQYYQRLADERGI